MVKRFAFGLAGRNFAYIIVPLMTKSGPSVMMSTLSPTVIPARGVPGRGSSSPANAKGRHCIRTVIATQFPCLSPVKIASRFKIAERTFEP
jgi:hypothetical protein